MHGRTECETARPGDLVVTESIGGRVWTSSSGDRVPLRGVLRTADGVAIEAAYRPPPRGGADAPVLVVAHGFSGALDRPALAGAAEVFGARAAVVTFSFRGHGRSGGRSTVGDREVLDLAAAVRWARAQGHRRVATVGFSLGGSVALRHAALFGTALGSPREGTDAVVAVSAPARWYYRGTAPMRRLHWAVQRPLGRAVTRWGLRTRVDAAGWAAPPLSPTQAAPRIAPTPLLVVHGDRDTYFPLDHPRSVVAAADASCTRLWIEGGFGHAENAAPPELLDRVARWAVSRI
ncbi:alpha/beta hydrolase [Streptomyces sp. TR02-1]|uniref:alpha/beta hydrolase n=1 Tax=Streptomyces sp. TR02-1 TaxID=3385977 RepID=UPI0039A3368B